MPNDVTVRDSILNSVKKLIGPSQEYDYFDDDLIIHINTFLGNLVQAGVGTRDFVLVDASQTWEDFLGSGHTHLQQAKTYVYLRVKAIFDPPSSSYALDAMTKAADELLWRLNVDVDPGMQVLFENED